VPKSCFRCNSYCERKQNCVEDEGDDDARWIDRQSRASTSAAAPGRTGGPWMMDHHGYASSPPAPPMHALIGRRVQARDARFSFPLLQIKRQSFVHVTTPETSAPWRHRALSCSSPPVTACTPTLCSCREFSLHGSVDHACLKHASIPHAGRQWMNIQRCLNFVNN